MRPSLSGIASMATRAILAELTEAYGRETGVIARIQSVGGVDAAQRVRAGEGLDVVVLASRAMAALEVEGRLVRGSRVDVARSGMAIAVPADAPCPEIGDEEAVKAAILQARAIGYSTGPSGEHLQKLVQQWGIAEAVSPRMRCAPPGTPVAALVARGEVDLGFQQLSELLHTPGVQIVGPLPASIQAVTVFSAGVASTSDHQADARALIGYLASPPTAEVKRRHGMEPAASVSSKDTDHG